MLELSPDGHSLTIRMAEESSVSHAIISDLVPMTTYTTTVSCFLEDGTESEESESLLHHPWQVFDPPSGDRNVCDGFGEILTSGACACDTKKGFVSRAEGGCACDAANKFVYDGASGCECDASAGFASDGAGGCKCDASAGFASDGEVRARCC